MRHPAPRRGVTLMLVLIFLALLLTLWGISYRQIACALRVQAVRSQYTSRDQGSLQALAQGLTLLQSGLPPSDPFVCATNVVTVSGTRSYRLTFTSSQYNVWTVNAVATPAGETVDPMPATFAPPTE